METKVLMKVILSKEKHKAWVNGLEMKEIVRAWSICANGMKRNRMGTAKGKEMAF